MKKNEYRIVDNFLPENLYENLKTFLYSGECPWYHRESQVQDTNEDSNGFFTFCWYNNWKEKHNSFDSTIKPILEELKCISPIQIRANLLLKSSPGESAYHTDYTFPTTTAIIYFTKCNGGTVLKIENKEILVDCIENRLLEFNGAIEHKGIWQTDVKKRIVINMNYIK